MMKNAGNEELGRLDFNQAKARFIV